MSHEKIFNLASTGVFAALLAVIAPLSIPLPGLVPISLATFVIYLTSAILGWKRSLVGVGVYIMIGIVGLPVFSGYNAGFGVIVGPTGGYVIGYLFIAFATGFVSDKMSAKFSFIGMIVGTLITYIIGTLWYSYVVGLSFFIALSSAVLPFVVVDCIKIAVATGICVPIKRRLKKSRMVS